MVGLLSLFTNILDFNLKKKLVKYCVWSLALQRYWNLDTSESRSEIPGKF